MSLGDSDLFRIVMKSVAHSVATPALLCHKEPSQGMHNAPMGDDSLWHKNAEQQVIYLVGRTYYYS